jgi:hypothetical protein
VFVLIAVAVFATWRLYEYKVIKIEIEPGRLSVSKNNAYSANQVHGSSRSASAESWSTPESGQLPMRRQPPPPPPGLYHGQPRWQQPGWQA